MTRNGEHRRVLPLLARRPNGRTEAFLLLYGCTRQHLDGLCQGQGLTSAVRIGKRTFEDLRQDRHWLARRRLAERPAQPRPRPLV